MATALNKITIPGILVNFLIFFIYYLMYNKNKNLEETIIQCIYLNWVYIIASVIRYALIDDASSQLADVRIGNHIYRYKKLMVAPMMCKFVLFGRFIPKFDWIAVLFELNWIAVLLWRKKQRRAFIPAVKH